MKKKRERTLAHKVNGLHCLFTNSQNMGYKQNELELLVQKGTSYLIGMMETWWDNSYVWNVETEGCNLLKRKRNNRKGGVNALCLKSRLFAQKFK